MAGERTFKIRIVGTSTDAEQALDRVRHSAQRLEGTATTVGSKLGGMAKLGLLAVGAAAVGGAYALGNFAVEAVKDAEAAQAVDAGLLNVTKSMNLFGAQTGSVVSRLQDYAAQMGVNIGVDDEAIKQVQTKLMTFAALSRSADQTGGAFDRATKAAFDLASAGFGEASTNAVQLGKALQDPIRGITALARSGVTFTAQEREKIKALVESNRLTEAQGMILATVERQVGGTAAATATGSQKLSAAFGEIKESIGQALLPAVEKLANWVTTKLVPAFQSWWSQHGPAVTKAMGEAADWMITKLVPALGDLWQTLQRDVFPVLQQWWAIFTEEVLPTLRDVSDAIGKLGAIFGQSSGEGSGFSAVMGMVTNALSGLRVVWIVLHTVVSAFSRFITDAAEKAATFINGLRQLWAVLGQVAGALVGAGRAVIDGFIHGVQAAWGFVGAWFAGLGGRVAANVGRLAGVLTGQGRELLGGLWDGIRGKWDGVADWLRGLDGKVVNAVGNLAGVLTGAGRSILQGFLDGLRAKWEEIKNLVGGMGQWIKDHKGPESVDRALLIPAGEQIMSGLGVGLRRGAPGVQRFLHDFTGALAAPSGTAAAQPNGAPINITINAGLGTNPRELGAAVVDAIKAHERANGPVFAAA